LAVDLDEIFRVDRLSAHLTAYFDRPAKEQFFGPTPILLDLEPPNLT